MLRARCLVLSLLVSVFAPAVLSQLITDETEAQLWANEYNERAQTVFSQYMFAAWDYATDINDDNQQKQVEANGRLDAFQKEAYVNASKYDWNNFSNTTLKRLFRKITQIGTAALNESDSERVNQLGADLERDYSTAKVCNKPGDSSGKCYPLDPDLTKILATSDDWDELLWAWIGWRNASGRTMKDKYEEFVKLQNMAAEVNGYDDTGAYWRSWYEMDDFEAECERLWDEVKPLYQNLHAYVRRKLKEHYKDRSFPVSGHIPAHLLGNMWSQQWNNIFKLVEPFGGVPSVDVTDALVNQGYNATTMMLLSEEFFTSLGLEKMPPEFWEHSMLVKPDDREAVCHASAWDFYNGIDFRIKQCTEPTMEWLITTHHEMGHVAYFLEYKDLHVTFRDGANPGFHEAVGDILSLSVSTPEHLKEIGLLEEIGETENADLNYLMSMALDKIAFLPFGFLMDQWRWSVFRGETPKDKYTTKWWQLRCKYQGIAPPVYRSEDDFDPGAKYHIPSNTPYVRYFVSYILQFQFYKAMCEAANNTRALHRCDFYRSMDAGEKLKNMLKLGSSKPWQDAMEQLSGERKMNASALMEYFQPLTKWLMEQNQNAVENITWQEECPIPVFANEEDAAAAWLEDYNARAQDAYSEAAQASWDYNTNITDHNRQKSVEASVNRAAFQKQAFMEASQFSWRNFENKNISRLFSKITDIGTAVLSAEDNVKVNDLESELEGMYSTGKACNKPGDNSGKCYPLDPDLTQIMASSRDWDELIWAWKTWRDVTGKLMKDKYEEFVSLQNKAAKENRYDDTGAYWRSWYEMDNFEAECDRLWNQVKPLYQNLHAYVRRKLMDKYSGKPFPDSGHIPAHILGNMWAQQWHNIFSEVEPYAGKAGVDVSDALKDQGYNATAMMRLSEEFFTSLGLEAMPDSFWQNSMLEKPTDRDVVCHASAWDFYNQRDFRIKQCTEPTMSWLITSHHEMGHVAYYLAYKHLPVPYRRGANPGFHEAVGDVLSLSVSTPEHLHEIGLLDQLETDEEADINYLMRQALQKIAFLPFGFLIDQWRWSVFRNETTKDQYNTKWWQLRCKYQGVSPPVDRSEEDFDPGAKFHIPANTPYIRYFVSFILQFQFYRELCKASGHTGPLHRCDIYRSTSAGEKLSNMLALGSSQPWQDAMEQLSGGRSMDASALVEYFQPLYDWLQRQNARHPIIWHEECPPVPPPPTEGPVQAATSIQTCAWLLIAAVCLAFICNKKGS